VWAESDQNAEEDMKKKLKLVKEPHRMAMCEDKMRYGFFLGDERVGEAYFNMRGYLAVFTKPNMGFLLHEMNLTELKAEVARYNRISARKAEDEKKLADTYFTHGHNIEGCLRNGSFVVLRSQTAAGRQGKYAQYMNGDFMGHVEAVPTGMVEVAGGLALRLLPKCCGGKG
jgi:hypothetical protein